MPDERQAGLRSALAPYLHHRSGCESLNPRVKGAPFEACDCGLRAALAAQVPAREEREDTPKGWEWQCAGCHRPVAPMGMCETCGVVGIALGDESKEDGS